MPKQVLKLIVDVVDASPSCLVLLYDNFDDFNTICFKVGVFQALSNARISQNYDGKKDISITAEKNQSVYIYNIKGML